MKQEINPDLVAPISPDFFLPPINRWLSLGGIVMLVSVVSAIAFTGVFRYRVTVKAPAKIRPEGELRLVQAVKAGKITHIAVKTHQKVKQGDIIASLDDFSLQQDLQQLQSNLQATETQIEQLQALIISKNNQINAEKQQINNQIAGLQAELNLERNNYQNLQIELNTTLKTAQANFDLAQDQLTRYQNLVATGAIAVLQLKEQESAYRNAEAQLQKAIAKKDPSNQTMEIVRQKIAQTKAQGNATIAQLEQEQQTLLQEQIKLQAQLKSDRKNLIKITAELADLLIRSPASGIIQELNLRNSGQVIIAGNAIATIAPSESSLTVKAAVNTSEISRVEVGQLVRMRVSSCPYTDYGILSGEVTTISPDAITQGKVTAYEVTIEPHKTTLQQATRQCTIQSGMEGRADIITEEEALFRYLVRKLKIR
jgi:HlyD family type I secretion membrane fusion protein